MKERLSLAAVVFAAFACGSFVARAEIVFAKGVTLESGWYDVNKAYWPATLNITVDGEGTVIDDTPTGDNTPSGGSDTENPSDGGGGTSGGDGEDYYE